MSKGDTERKKIFVKYSTHLSQLKEWGYLADLTLPNNPNYICPICLQMFGLEALDQQGKNPLTLEDVPPKSLGGKANILTCRQCNNKAGQQIDANLQKNLQELDKRQFLPNMSFSARMEQDGKFVQGQVMIDSNREIRVRHDYKHNKNDELDSFIGKISPTTGNPLLNIDFNPVKVDFKRMQVALLKTAYLSCFEKYGYAFVLDPIYNVVRDQIRNPDQEIYPNQFWLYGPFENKHAGVHFVQNKGLECVMSIFSLETAMVRVFGAILPIKTNPIIEIVAGYHAALSMGLPREAEIKRMDAVDGYLFNKENLIDLFAHIAKLRRP